MTEHIEWQETRKMGTSSPHSAVNSTLSRPWQETATYIDKPSLGKRAAEGRSKAKSITTAAEELQERCRQICASVFFSEYDALSSLGFTSPSAGEGKSFVSILSARTLAVESNIPVLLMEYNWEHASLRDYFSLPPGPGLAEWLRGEANAEQVRYRVSPNLTIVPAGNARREEIKLLHYLRQQGNLKLLQQPNEVAIVDLPSTVTTAYGPLAARAVEALVVVVHNGVTPISFVKEACNYYEDLRVYGFILNQFRSAIPRWLQYLL